ncbi:hypothetical protein [Brevundimonas goettingensis]|uniref:Lipoprotein n=1 Tax=Brevundimonas goettingensis TaxID=2774190 RepID=A0A975GVU5_9CAUL|nr:hypothetical protein [Brevundimonas goettingensis]QTC91827.1 hypothetical protein IFJ75_02540 [Brevundimonas goettingensis]
MRRAAAILSAATVGLTACSASQPTATDATNDTNVRCLVLFTILQKTHPSADNTAGVFYYLGRLDQQFPQGGFEPAVKAYVEEIKSDDSGVTRTMQECVSAAKGSIATHRAAIAALR